MKEICHSCSGKNFGDILPAIQGELRNMFPRMQLIRQGAVAVLTKGETMVLDERIQSAKVILGLGWDPLGSEAVDLDASCVIFDNSHRNESVFYGQLRSKSGNVLHFGDNLTGEGEGDDERMSVDLSRVGPNVKALYFVVTSYSRHPFSRVRNAYVRMMDQNFKELIRFQLSGGGGNRETAMIMMKLYRKEGRWSMKAIGHGTQGRVVQDCVPLLTRELCGRLKVQSSSFKYSTYADMRNTPQHANNKKKDNLLLYIFLIIVSLFLLWKL